jgi:hypothetical protein
MLSTYGLGASLLPSECEQTLGKAVSGMRGRRLGHRTHPPFSDACAIALALPTRVREIRLPDAVRSRVLSGSHF